MPARFFLSPEQVNTFNADQWLAQQNTRLADDWMQQQQDALQAPSSDALTNPLGSGNQPQQDLQGPPSAGSETDTPSFQQPASDPSPPELTTPAAPALPAPTAPPPTDYGPVPQATTQRPLAALPATPTPAPTQRPFGGVDLVAYARQAAQRAGIDPNLFVSQINQESGFDPRSVSSAGARGIAQIVPRFHPGVNPDNPTEALDYAANLMAQHLKTYGGDIRQALVAYNGGQGAVNALNAGTPYQESVDYVKKILGGSAGTLPQAAGDGQMAASTSSLSLSQFGDQTLTAEEAYSACGPAAAARLAAEYGNAIPLNVALAAAKQVGWTPGGGMNGIANEKKLMDALGLPAEIDTTGDWGEIIRRAAAGQLVTISTPGHYFQANAARPRGDGQTELYVGQSGRDLKAGKEWMTPQEIEAAMGSLNGALFSDPSKQVTAGDWYQAQAQNHGFGEVNPQPIVAELGQAAQKAGVQPQAPDETVFNPFGEAFRQLGAVKDQVGSALQGAGEQFVRNVTGTNPNQAELDRQFAESGVRLPTNPLEALGGSGLGAPTSGEQLTEQRNRAIEQGNPLRDVPVLGGASTFVGQAALDPTNPLLMGEPGVARGVGRAAGEAGAAISELATAPETQALLRTRQRGEGINPFSLLVPEGAKPNAVEQVLDSGLILPKAEPPTGPTQILGPRGELLSTVASREGPPAPGVGVVRSAAGAVARTEPTAANAARMPNLTKMAVDMPEVQATIQRVAEENPELIDAFRQGKITHQQLVEDMAPRLGMTAEDFLNSKVGQAFNPEELVTLRAAVVQKQAQAVQLAQDIADKGGVNAMSAEDKVNAISQIVDAARLQAVARGGASTAGRTLNQQKIVITQEMAKAITGGNEAVAAQRALNAAKAKAAWAEAKLAALDKAGGTTSATLRSNLRSEMAQAGRQAGQEVIDAGKPLGVAYDEALAAAKADLKASNNYLEDAFDNQIKQLEQEAAKRAAKARGAQGEGDVAWLQAQAKAARMEENAANVRTQRAFDESLRVRERQQQQAGRLLEKLGGREVTDEVLKNFIDAQNSSDPLAAAKFLQSLQHVSWWDRVSILRYASMLSATSTHLVNAFGNTINVGLDVALKPVSVGIDVARAGITGGERTRYMGELAPQVRGLLEGAATGLSEGLVSLKTGINPRDAGKLEGVRAGFQSGNKVVDTVVEAPLRLLTFSDNVFRGAARGAETRVLAARRAIQEGYTGDALRTRVSDIMANLTDYPDLMAEAEKRAAKAVLQEPNKFASAITSVGRGPGAVNAAQRIVREIVVPFTKTPLNILGQGLEMTPSGLLKVADRARAGDVGGATDAAARVAFGSALMVGVGSLAAHGMVTGGYPADPKDRETLPTGWQPWSMQLPNGDGGHTYISFSQMGPVAIPMAIAAIAGQSMREGVVADPATLAGSLGKFMLDQTFLQGLSAIVDAVKDPKRYGENVSEQLATSFVPYAALSRQLTRALDMADRDPKGAIQAIQALTPMTAGNVPRRQDALGRDIHSTQSGIGAFISPARYSADQPEPVLKAFRDVGEGLPSAPKEIRLRSAVTGSYSPPVALSEVEQNTYQQIFGQRLQERVAAIVNNPSWQQRSAESRKRYLEAQVQAARQYAENQVYSKMTPDDRQKRMQEGRQRQQIKPLSAT